MKEKLKQVNFAKRDAEKKALRESDINAVSNGISAKILRKKNFMFSGIDMAKVVIVAPDGRRLLNPSNK